MDYSPPLSTSSSYSYPSSRRDSMTSVSDLDDLDDYLASYVPLSNLPTPPPAKAQADRSDAVQGRRAPDLRASDELAGPATHLANLVPSNACLHRPSVGVIHSYLLRSELPQEVLGLSACILDALSTRFAQHWRRACCSLPPVRILDGQRTRLRSHVLTASPVPCQVEWESYVHNHGPDAEILVLSALSIASSYQEDVHRPSLYWTDFIADGAFTTAQLNATVRSVLVDIDYELHSFTPRMIEQAMHDMRRAGGLRGRDGHGVTSDKEGQQQIQVPALADGMNETGSASVKGKPIRLSLQPSTAAFVNGLPTPGPSPPC